MRLGGRDKRGGPRERGKRERTKNERNKSGRELERTKSQKELMAKMAGFYRIENLGNGCP